MRTSDIIDKNINKLGKKHQPHPMSKTLDAFEEKICNVTAPANVGH